MMADKKGKPRGEITQSRKNDRELKNKKRKNLSYNNKNKKEQANEKRPRRGPRLPNALQKELNLFNPTVGGEPSDGDEEIDFDDAVGNDVYEYEEAIPEEESKKNRRFDPVENYQFELPEDFEVSHSICLCIYGYRYVFAARTYKHVKIPTELSCYL